MVGDGTELTVGEAATQLRISDTTVRSYVADHLLKARWTAGGHARITAASVGALAAVLTIPPGAERDRALEQLRSANRPPPPAG